MNAWSNPDEVPNQDVASMAAFLEQRANTTQRQRLHQAVIDALNPLQGSMWLDIGCGTGAITRRLGACVGPSGRVVGIDISAAMLQVARTQTNDPVMHYEQADAAKLLYPDGIFDGGAAIGVLLHANDHIQLLKEARRVIRNGGSLGVLERDWGTLAVDHSLRALTRKILDWRCDHYGGDNWMGRQLVRKCIQTGWCISRIEPVVSVARDKQDALVDTLQRTVHRALHNRVISEEEYSVWMSEMEQRLSEGTFFASINDYLVVAQ